MANHPFVDGPEEQEPDLLPLKTELTNMCQMAFQISLTQIVRQVLTITDAAFLGHLGTKELAGVSLAAVWQGVPSTFVQFSIQAVTTLSSQAKGAGNKKLCGEWLQMALVWAMVGMIPVLLIYACVGWLVGLTMADVEVQKFAQEFSLVMAIALPAQYAYVALTSFFATIDVVAPASVCTAITMIMNIGFNQLFIYGCGSWKGFGFIGSPLATVTSAWTQLGIFILYTIFIKKYHVEYWGGWTKKALTRERFKTFMGLGAPAGASSVVDWASAAMASAFSGLLGIYVASSFNVLGGLFSMTYSAVAGFATATQILLAGYLGEGRPKAAQRMFTIGFTTLALGGLVACMFVGFFHDDLWRVWTTDEGLVHVCNTALLSFMACIMCAFIRFTLTAVMSSLGTKEANVNLVANNIASWLIYVPLSYVMPITWGMGVPGFWWADFLGEAFKTVVLAWGITRVDWRLASKEAQRKALEEERCSPTASIQREEAREFSVARSRAASMSSPTHSHTGIMSRGVSMRFASPGVLETL